MTYMNDTPSPVQFKAYRFLFYACFICSISKYCPVMSGEGKEHSMRVMRYPIYRVYTPSKHHSLGTSALSHIVKYFLHGCSSLNPNTSLILLLLIGASNSPIALVKPVPGQTLFKNVSVGVKFVIESFVALKTWNPSPDFRRPRSHIRPRSRASIYDHPCTFHFSGSCT